MLTHAHAHTHTFTHQTSQLENLHHNVLQLVCVLFDYDLFCPGGPSATQWICPTNFIIQSCPPAAAPTALCHSVWSTWKNIAILFLGYCIYIYCTACWKMRKTLPGPHKVSSYSQTTSKWIRESCFQHEHYTWQYSMHTLLSLIISDDIYWHLKACLILLNVFLSAGFCWFMEMKRNDRLAEPACLCALDARCTESKKISDGC